MKQKLLDFLTLNYPALKGVRTLAGLLMFLGPQIVDRLLGSGICANPGSTLCITLNALAAWFLAMGIRGK